MVTSNYYARTHLISSHLVTSTRLVKLVIIITTGKRSDRYYIKLLTESVLTASVHMACEMYLLRRGDVKPVTARHEGHVSGVAVRKRPLSFFNKSAFKFSRVGPSMHGGVSSEASVHRNLLPCHNR